MLGIHLSQLQCESSSVHQQDDIDLDYDLRLFFQVNNAKLKDYSDAHNFTLENTRYASLISKDGRQITALKSTIVWLFES